MFVHRYLVGFALAGLAGILVGCGKPGSETPAASDPKSLFDMHCAKCHAQAGQPGGPPGIGSSKGPNLSRIGAEPGHSADWLARYVADPKSVKADSKMPKFEGKLKEEEIRMLAEYLAAQK